MYEYVVDRQRAHNGKKTRAQNPCYRASWLASLPKFIINATIWWDEINLDDSICFLTLLAWTYIMKLGHTVYAPLTSDLNYFYIEQHLWMGNGFKAFELVSEIMLAKFSLLYFAARPSSTWGWGENFPGNKIRFGVRLRLLVSCRYLQHFLSKRRLPTIEGSDV